MPEEPIRERILQHCETSLGLINGTGPYHYALVSVQRGKAIPPEDLAQLPAAFLDEGEETVTQDTNLLLMRRLQITVEAWLRSDAGALPTGANRLLADLERAVAADPTRGGLAIRTELVGTNIVADESPGVLASARAEFAIEYWTLKGNPASKG